jgi:uncharacterized protein
MECPRGKKDTLKKARIGNVQIDHCTECGGIWFDNDELRQAKDVKYENMNWLDVDLWKDETKFEISPSGRLCPRDRMPLYEVEYDNSKVRVDLCNICNGVWLDKGEFERIIDYLKEKSDYEILHHFSKNLVRETWEMFDGPETMRENLHDIVTLIKLFQYRFMIQHPYLAMAIKSILPPV